MLTRDVWLVEEPVLDEPADLLTIPELKQYFGREPHDEELGLRALLETPETPPSPWWCEEQPRRRVAGRSRRNRSALERAAS